MVGERVARALEDAVEGQPDTWPFQWFKGAQEAELNASAAIPDLSVSGADHGFEISTSAEETAGAERDPQTSLLLGLPIPTARDISHLRPRAEP